MPRVLLGVLLLGVWQLVPPINLRLVQGIPSSSGTVVTITAPTSSATYDAGTSATLTTLAGTAKANQTISACTWTNSLGGSGSATGTGTWSIASVALTVGDNVITVTCPNAIGTGTDLITVTRSAGSSETTVDCSGNTCYYIRDGGSASTTGTGACVSTGSGNWNTGNACDNLPATLVRGAYYLFADGAYGSKTLTTATSGTTPIRFFKATILNHGTATGWVDTYGDGQAVFGDGVNFQTDYWIFNGQIGTDYASGHGFKVDNSASTNTELCLFGQPGSTDASHITVTHLDMIGRGYDQTTVNDRGFYSNSTGATDYTISHSYISGVGVPILTRQVDTLVFEYNYIEGNHSQPASHGEPWSDTGTDNVIFRYNRIRNPEGTAVFFIGNGSGGVSVDSNTSTAWEIYGNLFYYQSYTPGVGHDPGVSAILWAPDNAGTGGDTYVHQWVIYNNTFYDFSHGTSSGRILARDDDPLVTLPIVRNNFWDSCADGASHTNLTLSHNYYRSTTHTAESNEQIGTGSLLTSPSTGVFTLTAATTAGSSLSSPYTTDLAGVTRGADGTWDRGAYEYTAAAPDPVAVFRSWVWPVMAMR